MTRIGVSKFVMMFKSKTSGINQEWKMVFTEHGLVMVRKP
jgi:hypothetical protein